jgi:hypothetical protein
MVARGALIKPWLFREMRDGYRDVGAEERLAIYRRYVELALEHWHDDERGRANVREFVAWHLGFWCRYANRRPDGSWPSMQEREPWRDVGSPLDALLARGDAAAHGWLAERLVARDDVDPAEAPPAGGTPEDNAEAAFAAG